MGADTKGRELQPAVQRRAVQPGDRDVHPGRQRDHPRVGQSATLLTDLRWISLVPSKMVKLSGVTACDQGSC